MTIEVFPKIWQAWTMLVIETMKTFVSLFLTLGVVSLAQANTIRVSAPNSLNGSYAYTLGVNANLPVNEQFSSMTISFNNVQLTSAPKGYLYVDLLNLNTPGTTAYRDGDQAGDFFASYVTAGQGVSLGVEQFNYWYQTRSFSISLNTDQLAALNMYGQDGIFDIGLDPDCFFKLYGSCEITYDYCPKTPPSVPDNGWTVAMLGVPFLSLMFMRRKLAWN